MVRILHAADFHLDSAFTGLSEQQARQRQISIEWLFFSFSFCQLICNVAFPVGMHLQIILSVNHLFLSEILC